MSPSRALVCPTPLQVYKEEETKSFSFDDLPSVEAVEWPCAIAATLYVTKALTANTPTANAERDFLPIACALP